MRVKCFVFDMAGTIINDDGNIVRTTLMESMMSCNFIVKSDDIDAVMGMPKKQAIGSLLNMHVEPIHKDFIKRMIKHYESHASLIDGVLDAIDFIHHNGVRVALDTGFPREIADVIIKKLNIGSRIDILVTPDDVGGVGRPHAKMINKISDELQVFPHEIIKVGDTVSDIEEGLNAGCLHSVGVTTGTCSPNQLADAGATMVVSSIWELIARTIHMFGSE